jgi:hypothetical protein
VHCGKNKQKNSGQEYPEIFYNHQKEILEC